MNQVLSEDLRWWNFITITATDQVLDGGKLLTVSRVSLGWLPPFLSK